MNKIWILFKREYLAAVKTKSFLISIILVPVLMGGSIVAMFIMENNQDTTDKTIAVIDRSGLVEDVLKNAAAQRNTNDIYNPETGEKIAPAFLLEFVPPDSVHPAAQQLALSDRVRSKELHAFIEVGKDILHPSQASDRDYIRYYSEHSFMDDIRYWFSNTINNYMRQQRLEALDLDKEVAGDLFAWINIEGMSLVEVDRKTGEQQEAGRTNEMQSFLVPYFVIILMFMLTLMSSVPLLSAVMEEKSEKIAEVLLGSVTPFQFMAGKVAGGIGIGLTVAVLYLAAIGWTASRMDVLNVVPMELIPWFLVYMLLYIIMVGSGMAALGATCNDNKDAQSLQFPSMLPVIIPMFVLVPIIQNPSGALATTLSLIPPFTPPLMLVRMATPVTIPVWQPVLGLALVLLFTVFTVWIGARIFRTAILMTGQKPSIKNLIKFAFKN
jgi:ABC-2 type transport system permease protein